MEQNRSRQLRRMVRLALYSAILLALGLPNSPLHFLGFPAYGPFNATTLHMIVILTAVLEGPTSGAILGLVMGLLSMFTAFTGASVTAPAFMNPLISVLPRVLVGFLSGLLFHVLRRSRAAWVPAVVGAFGAVVNTVLVLGGIFLFGLMIESIGAVSQIMKAAISTTILFNALPEAALSAVVVLAITKALAPLYRRSGMDIYRKERTIWD